MPNFGNLNFIRVNFALRAGDRKYFTKRPACLCSDKKSMGAYLTNKNLGSLPNRFITLKISIWKSAVFIKQEPGIIRAIIKNTHWKPYYNAATTKLPKFLKTAYNDILVSETSNVTKFKTTLSTRIALWISTGTHFPALKRFL